MNVEEIVNRPTYSAFSEIKEHQVFYSHGYLWKVRYNDNTLMLLSNSDGFNRWCEITKENTKGFGKNLNINAL